MKLNELEIESIISLNCFARGDSDAKSRFQFSGWCMSAKPPTLSPLIKFKVNAARS